MQRQIRCFPYGEHSDVPRLQQVEQKAVGRQKNLGLGLPTKDGTYPWTSVTQIFCSAKPSLGGEDMTLTLPLGTFGSVASLLTAILYLKIPDI